MTFFSVLLFPFLKRIAQTSFDIFFGTINFYYSFSGNSRILSLAPISFSCGIDVPAIPFIDPMKWLVLSKTLSDSLFCIASASCWSISDSFCSYFNARSCSWSRSLLFNYLFSIFVVFSSDISFFADSASDERAFNGCSYCFSTWLLICLFTFSDSTFSFSETSWSILDYCFLMSASFCLTAFSFTAYSSWILVMLWFISLQYFSSIGRARTSLTRHVNSFL